MCVERPSGTGAAIERLEDPTNPISATVGLRVEPAAPGTGVDVRCEVDGPSVPLHIYRTRAAFAEAVRGHVLAGLRHGPFGWQVTDCVVRLTACDYYGSDGRVPPGTTRTTARDFRLLVPVVVRAAVREAGTTVCEPIARLDLELPLASLSATLTMLGQLGASLGEPEVRGDVVALVARVRVARLEELRRRLVDATGGYGVVEVGVDGYAPVRGTPPARPGGGRPEVPWPPRTGRGRAAAGPIR